MGDGRSQSGWLGGWLGADSRVEGACGGRGDSGVEGAAVVALVVFCEPSQVGDRRLLWDATVDVAPGLALPTPSRRARKTHACPCPFLDVVIRCRRGTRSPR